VKLKKITLFPYQKEDQDQIDYISQRYGLQKFLINFPFLEELDVRAPYRTDLCFRLLEQLPNMKVLTCSTSSTRFDDSEVSEYLEELKQKDDIVVKKFTSLETLRLNGLAHFTHTAEFIETYLTGLKNLSFQANLLKSELPAFRRLIDFATANTPTYSISTASFCNSTIETCLSTVQNAFYKTPPEVRIANRILKVALGMKRSDNKNLTNWMNFCVLSLDLGCQRISRIVELSVSAGKNLLNQILDLPVQDVDTFEFSFSNAISREEYLSVLDQFLCNMPSVKKVLPNGIDQINKQ
jgi:hypothetical protein